MLWKKSWTCIILGPDPPPPSPGCEIWTHALEQKLDLQNFRPGTPPSHFKLWTCALKQNLFTKLKFGTPPLVKFGLRLRTKVGLRTFQALTPSPFVKCRLRLLRTGQKKFGPGPPPPCLQNLDLHSGAKVGLWIILGLDPHHCFRNLDSGSGANVGLRKFWAQAPLQEISREMQT